MTKEKIFKFARKRNVAFIASIDMDGFPVMRAMLKPRKIEGNDFYFSTNTSSNKIKEFLKDCKASIYFYKKGLFKYVGVCLKGHMEVLTDQKTKDEIWHVGDSMFYKQGKTDPNYCVLKFTAESARIYCNLKCENVKF